VLHCAEVDLDMLDLENIFSSEGACAAVLQGWRSRPQQLAMAEAVERAIAGNSVLLAEAGTGTGKTLAYLIPALLSGGKVDSTGTKPLQAQLFPSRSACGAVARAFACQVGLLKGRANYVCHHHLQRNLSDGRLPLATMRPGSPKSPCFADNQPQRRPRPRPQASGGATPGSTRFQPHTCLGSECSQFKDCLGMAARKAALVAEVGWSTTTVLRRPVAEGRGGRRTDACPQHRDPDEAPSARKKRRTSLRRNAVHRAMVDWRVHQAVWRR